MTSLKEKNNKLGTMNSQNSSSIPLKNRQSLIQSVDVFCSEYGYKIQMRMCGDQIYCQSNII